MQPENSGVPQIKVEMFGEFSITINGNQLTNLTGRTKRVWLLIQYLIANRFKDVTTDMLQDVLWKDGDCGDPLNALKNLVYRARETLKKISGAENGEFIEFSGGKYQWNNNYPCSVDSEVLVRNWDMIKDSSLPEEERIRACNEVLSIYRGKFLPKSCYCTWVVSLASVYELRYIDCILNGCGLLIKQNRYDNVIRLCSGSLVHVPLEESIHKMLLYAYIGSNRREEAMVHYNRTAELFYSELGVDISDTLLPMYRQMTSSMNHVESDLNCIKKDLKEHKETYGAYFCDYDVFKAIYRIQARTMTRTGIAVFLVLFTINDLGGASPDEESAKAAGVKLKEAILCSLRRGDTVTSYSSTQFMAMLPVTSYENARFITDRILQKFRFLYRKNNLRVLTTIKPVDPVE